MTAVTHPALQRFVAQIGEGLTLGQVFIRPTERGYELRLESDRPCAPEDLRLVPLTELRALAQCTAHGAFRPLKSAPDLQSGWRSLAASDLELEQALNQLYPGAVADWDAAQTRPPPVTNYREFTGRQTGMYRATTLLDDAQAAQAIRACCHRRFCLKRRLWTVAGLAVDEATEKSLIPCLEPCAVLLELARKAQRIQQQETVEVGLSLVELETLQAALEAGFTQAAPSGRVADFHAPANPRRRQLLLEKLKLQLAVVKQRATRQDSG